MQETKTIALEKNLTIRDITNLRRKLNRAMGQTSLINIDFKDVDSVDISGLSLLINLGNMLKNRGGRLVIAGARKEIRELLEIADVQSVAEIEGA